MSSPLPGRKPQGCTLHKVAYLLTPYKTWNVGLSHKRCMRQIPVSYSPWFLKGKAQSTGKRLQSIRNIFFKRQPLWGKRMKWSASSPVLFRIDRNPASSARAGQVPPFERGLFFQHKLPLLNPIHAFCTCLVEVEDQVYLFFYQGLSRVPPYRLWFPHVRAGDVEYNTFSAREWKCFMVSTIHPRSPLARSKSSSPLESWRRIRPSMW